MGKFYDSLIAASMGITVEELYDIKGKERIKTKEEKIREFENWIGFSLKEVDAQTITMAKGILRGLLNNNLTVSIGVMQTGLSDKWQDFSYVYHQTNYIDYLKNGLYVQGVRQYNLNLLLRIFDLFNINTSKFKEYSLLDGSCFDYMVVSTTRQNVNLIQNALIELENNADTITEELETTYQKTKSKILGK